MSHHAAEHVNEVCRRCTLVLAELRAERTRRVVRLDAIRQLQRLLRAELQRKAAP